MRMSHSSAAALCVGALLTAAIATGSSSAAMSSAASPSAHPPGSSSATVTFKVGHRGQTISSRALWRLHLKPGLYDATFKSIVFVQPNDPATTQVEVICGIVNAASFGSNTRVFVADASVQDAQNAPAATSGAATIRIGAKVQAGVVCFAGNATMQLYQPIAASFTPIDHRTFGSSHRVQLNIGPKVPSIFKR